MTDTLTTEERSIRMGLVRGADTKPEMTVRRFVHGKGYRYRLHKRDLPGRPDLAFPSRRKVIFVHGCFWHRHSDPNCKLARMPKSRTDFWRTKLEGNKERDQRNEANLRDDGWKVMVVWECELADKDNVGSRIEEFLE